MSDRGSERDRDQTNGEETVYHLPNSKPSSADDGWQTAMSQPSAYHATMLCRYLSSFDPDRLRTTTPTKAVARGLTPCKRCIGDCGPSNQSPTPCPLCGEEVWKVPSHLPDCDGGADDE